MIIDQAKQAVRERIWALLDAEGAVSPPGAKGHIPSFVGAEATAQRLTAIPAWQTAEVIKANPDRAQLPVRVLALEQRKLVYMAVPAMASEQPFYKLDPAELGTSTFEAAASKGAATLASTVSSDAMQPIDVVVCGTVAVNREGVRLGKGAGYSDIEVALLIEAGLVTEKTTIVTTVHALQVVDEPLPEAEHDFRVDVIVTPGEVIHCPAAKRPQGLVWENFTAEKVGAIPVLRDRRRKAVAGEDVG